MARALIGELLVKDGQIDAMQLNSALAHQRRWGGRLGEAMVQLGFLSEDRLLAAVGSQIGTEFVVIGQREVPPFVLSLMPLKLIRSLRAFPLEVVNEHRRATLVVAFADAGDLRAVDEIAFATGLDVKAVLAAKADVDQAISRHLGGVSGTGRPASAGRPRAIDLPADTSPLSGLTKKGFFH
ncbi:MAG: hypothetical protein WCC48_06995 [Anaeromyxobacteraceae bacterium]